MSDKRKEPPTAGESSSSVIKRQRQSNETQPSSALTIGSTTNRPSQAIIQGVKRTSALRAPIMELSGHVGEVFCCRFDSTGQNLASGSFDRSICTTPSLMGGS